VSEDLPNSHLLTMRSCTRDCRKPQDQTRHVARTESGDESKKFRESLLSESTVLLPGHPRLNNLCYLSSLSAQPVPRLDSSIQNTPSPCNRLIFPWLLRKVRMIPQILEVLGKLTVPVRGVRGIEEVIVADVLLWSCPATE
jgi:hypothetical protein